ncbi:uncharacterized protein LOC128966112 [Oppia nitens]|uniref:uncharacterized protein LOC128966112 n=1 Tax=Oppia nitens TaxID=1686743 RepID=UPI0023DBE956|nr:uncharacterized protein LOC128966112 [Oppia nitens]
MSLAIECGATHTVAIFVDENETTNEDNNNKKSDNKTTKQQMKRFHFGAANYKLLKPLQLEAFLQEIKSTTAGYTIQRIAIGMPGIIADPDKKALSRVVSKVWPNLSHVWVGNDTDTALACIDDTKYAIKCIVISGTGSCCYGNNGHKTVKIGGHGHIIGDRGSGYAISHMALREALKDFEYNHYSTDTTDTNGDTQDKAHEDKDILLNCLLKHLNLKSVYELVGWSIVASKAELADLAHVVIRQFTIGNRIARQVIEQAVDDLVNDIKCLTSQLRRNVSSHSHDSTNESIQIGFTGSLLTRSEIFSKLVLQKLKQNVKNIDVLVLRDTVMGALKMISPTNQDIGDSGLQNGDSVVNHMSREQLEQLVLPVATSLSLTEQRNQRSRNLHEMPVADAIELMISEETEKFQAIGQQIKSIEVLVNRITESFKNNGRLFYVGSGTSGRLGILDASECPPTFSCPSYLVQGIIAGGNKAIHTSVEGAEDSIIDGINAIDDKHITDKDVVIGIAACGRTPFVWGALYAARNHKAYTCLLCFNPNIQSRLDLDLVIAVPTGPEILTGSTRLKAGSATKCILNMLTTLSMVQLGKCFENLMVDLKPSNDKLRDRALRISLILLNDNQVSDSDVKQCLLKNNYDIKKTVIELRQTKQPIIA